MDTEIPAPYWVCETCYLAAEGLLEEEQRSGEELRLIPAGALITAGMGAAYHDLPCGTFDKHGEATGDECDCETRDFSWHPCDGCDSNLGGARYALTVREIVA